MDNSYWHKQTADKPLFSELLWSRPENRAHAGKLLIIGGNAHGFSAPAEAFVAAEKAGIGAARVLLPNVLQKIVGKFFAAGEFVPSTPSGSFAVAALAELLTDSSWADGVLLVGDFGKNSETAILLEKFAEKYSGQITITGDTADYFIPTPQKILSRATTTFIISLSQLQKLSAGAHFTHAFTSDMDLLRFVDALHRFTKQYPTNIIIQHGGNIFVAAGGEVSSTKLSETTETWQTKIAASAATWWLQNPTKNLEALTTAVI